MVHMMICFLVGKKARSKSYGYSENRLLQRTWTVLKLQSTEDLQICTKVQQAKGILVTILVNMVLCFLNF